MYYLNEAQQQKLLHHPETGMGYQAVEFLVEGNLVLPGIAYNAELVVELSEQMDEGIFANFASGFLDLSAHASPVLEIRFLPAGLPGSKSPAKVGMAPASGIHTGPAATAPVVGAPVAVFKRFSAYANDKRIGPNKELVPGTYATTAADAQLVHRGSQAVSRYALPNPAPAVNVFTIKPLGGTPIQTGIAQPAYGQPGGGVEVIFTFGTTPHTVTGPATIPP